MSVLDKAYQSFLRERFGDDERSIKKADLRARQLTVAEDTADERSGASFERIADRALLGIEQGRQATVRGIPGFVLSNIPIDSVKETGRSLVDENIRQQKELSQAGELIGGGPLGTASQMFSNIGTQMVVPFGASKAAVKALGSTQWAGKVAATLSKHIPGVTGKSLAAVSGGAVASGLQSASGTYSDALEAYLGQGMSRDQAESKANFAATLSGVLTGAVTAGFGATGLEALPTAFGLRPVREAVKEALKQAGAEGTEESVDQIGQSVIQKMTYNPNLTFEQAVKEVGIAFAAGGVMGGGLNLAANSIPAIRESIDIRNPRFNEDFLQFADYLAKRPSPRTGLRLNYPTNPFAEQNPASFQFQYLSDVIPPDHRDIDPSQGIGSLDDLSADSGVYGQELDANRFNIWSPDQQEVNPQVSPDLLDLMSQQSASSDTAPIADPLDELAGPTPGIGSLDELENTSIEAPIENETELNPSALDDEPALNQLQNEIEEPEEMEPEQGNFQTETQPETPKLQPAIETIPTTGIDKNFDWEDEVPSIDAENNQVTLKLSKSWTDPVDNSQILHASALPFGIDVSGIGERQAFLNFIQNPNDGQASRIGIGAFTPSESGSPQWIQLLTLEPGTPEFDQISNAVAGDGDDLVVSWNAINPSLINNEDSPWQQSDFSKIGARPVNDIDKGMEWDDTAIKFHDLPDWLYEYRDLPPESWPTKNPMDVSQIEKPEGLSEKLHEAFIDYVLKNDGNPDGWEQYLSNIIERVKSQTVPEDLAKIQKIKSKQKVEYPTQSTGAFSFDITGVTKDGPILLDVIGPITYEKYVNWKIGGGKSQEELDALKYNARKEARIQKDLVVYAYNQLLAERPKQTEEKEGVTDGNNTGTEGMGGGDQEPGGSPTKKGSKPGSAKSPKLDSESNKDKQSETLGEGESPGDPTGVPGSAGEPDTDQGGRTEGESDSGGGTVDGVNGSDGNTPDARGGDGGRDGGRGGIGEPSSDSPVSPNAPKIKTIERSNYRITDPEKIMGGGPKARFNRNKQAIQIIEAIEAEGRAPTSEELDVLAGYSGWGSFGQELFKGTYENPIFKDGWQAEGEWLLSHLTKEEYESLQTSILNSHYTDPPTVQAMWALVQKLGFKGGRILEPSVGAGNFLGLMPEEIESRSAITGIELDILTSKIAKTLYPQANIQNKRYELSRTADNFYDLVIGNWPFADSVPFDPRYQKIGAVLHDYFFLKALDQVRPGGIVIGVTSNGTMDKSSPYSRKAMARKGELIAAFRLPTGAFKEYAGTGVVTDILIFKKRSKEVEDPSQEGWIETLKVETKSGTDVKINEYFQSHPQNILGQLNFGHGTTSGIPGMIVERPDNLRELLAGLPDKIESDIAFEPWEPGKKFEGYIQNEGVEGRQGDLIIKDGELFTISGEQLAPYEKWKLKSVKDTQKRFDQIKRIISIRKTLRDLVDSQRKNSEDKEQIRKKLNAEYDDFVKLYGSITKSDGLKRIKAAKDPSVVEIASIEKVSEINGEETVRKSDIFTKDTTRSEPDIISPTLGDSFAIERSRTLDLDFKKIADRVGISEDDAINQLLNEGVIFKNSIGKFEASDVFLSGNVRAKLRELQEAEAQGMTGLDNSIKAIQAVIPKTIPYFLIEPQLGATYLTNEHYKDFVAHLAGIEGGKLKDSIEIQKLTSGWKIRFDRSVDFTEKSRLLSVPDAPGSQGNFGKLLEAAFNSKTVSYKRKEDGVTVFLEKETIKGNEIIDKIKEEFVDWVWKDAQRKMEVETSYNEMRNSFATPEFDGSHLSFPGLVLKKGENDFNFRKHQYDAVWRGIVSGRGVYAHEVGTGKTGVISALAMTARQFGIARKPMIWAHNANAATVYAEFLEMYPGAKVLFVDTMDKANKYINLNRIKMDDWDAVIIPHSITRNLNLRPETTRELVQRDLDDLAVAVREAFESQRAFEELGDLDKLSEEDVQEIRNPTAKQLVRERNKLLQRVRVAEQLADKPGTVFFEDLGIDMLMVDEAHVYKKIPLSTTQKVKGLQTKGTKEGTNLLYISEYLRRQNGGKGIHLLTGTPITNTLNETYTMMRFIMSDIMDKEVIRHWDDWFKSFSTTSSDIELNSAGEWEMVERIKSFINLPELKQIFGQYMDIVFARDMTEFAERPTREGRTDNPVGRPFMQTVNVPIKMTPTQEAQVAQQKENYKTWKSLDGKSKQEAMKLGSDVVPVIIEGQGSKTAIDPRMNDLSLPAELGSKVDHAVTNALKHYKEDPLTTQMFFMESGVSDFTKRSTRKKDANGKTITEKVRVFNVAKDIKAKLMEQGVPESEIVIFKDFDADEKAEIAKKMNTGEIRFAIGTTKTLGTGVNAQKYLRAVHHIDAPYTPGEFEQRNGRILRQGNTWNTAYEYRYITLRSLDARRWQIMLTKYTFIKMFMDPNFNSRTLEGDATDLGEGSSGSFEETFSEAAGDSRIMRRSKLQKDVEKLLRRERNHLEGIHDAEKRLNDLESQKIYRELRIQDLKLDLDHYRTQNSENFEAYVKAEGKLVKYDKPTKFDEDIRALSNSIEPDFGKPIIIGSYKGFDIVVYKDYSGKQIGLERKRSHNSRGAGSTSLENALSQIPQAIEQTEKEIADIKERAEVQKSQLGLPFPKQQELENKKKQLDDVVKSLALSPLPPPEWLTIGSPVGTLVYLNDGRQLLVTGHKNSDAGMFVVGSDISVDDGAEIDLPYQTVLDENGSKIYSSPEDLGIGSSDQTNDQAEQARIDSVLLQAVGHTAISQLISNPASGLSKRQVELANLLLNQIPAEFLSNLNLSISNPASGLSNQQAEFLSGDRFSVSNTVGQSNLQGSFSYLLNQANIFTGATNPTVAIEEIVHSLAKFLPENIRMGLEEDWKQKISDAQGSISENADEVDLLVGQILQEAIDSNGISTTRFMEILEASDVLDQQAVIDRAYPLINLDEYFAHGVSNKFSDIKIPKGIIDKSVEFLKSVWDVVKRFFGLKNQDLFDQIISKFKKGEFSPDVDNGMLFESNARIPAGAIAAFNKTEMAQQIAAAKIGLSEIDVGSVMMAIGAGISPSVGVFKKYTKGLSATVLGKVGVREAMEVEADIVAALAVVPDLNDAISTFEKDGHPELGDKLIKETWEGLVALNRKFENVAKRGQAAFEELGSSENLENLKSEIKKWNAEANKKAFFATALESSLEAAIGKNIEIIKSETASAARKETAKDLKQRLEYLSGANKRVASRIDDYMKILMQDPDFVNRGVFESPKVTASWVKSLLKKVSIPRGQGTEQDISRIAIRLIATNEGIRKAYAAAQFDQEQSKNLKQMLNEGEKLLLRAMRGKSRIVSVGVFLQYFAKKSASAAEAAVILGQKVKEFTNKAKELMDQAEAGVVAGRIISDPEWSQQLRGLGDPLKAIITPTLKETEKSLSDPEKWDSTTYVPIPENFLGQSSRENLIPLKLSSSDYRMVDEDTWAKNYRDLAYARDKIAAWLAVNQDSIYAPYYDRWYKMLSSFYLSDVVVNPPSFVNTSRGLNSLLSIPIALLEGMGIRSAQVARILGKQWERVHTMSSKLPDEYKARWTNLITKAISDHIDDAGNIGNSGDRRTYMTKVYSYLADSWQGGKVPFKVGDMLPSGEKVMASDMAVIDFLAEISKKIVDMTNAIEPTDADKRVKFGSFSEGTRVVDPELQSQGVFTQRGIVRTAKKMLGRTLSPRGIGAAHFFGEFWGWGKSDAGTWNYEKDWASQEDDARLEAKMPAEVQRFIDAINNQNIDQDVVMATMWDRSAETDYSASMLTRKDGLESIYPIIVREISDKTLVYSGSNIVQRIVELDGDITEAEAAARFTRDMQNAWKPLWKQISDTDKPKSHTDVIHYLESNNFTLGRKEKIAPSIAYAYGIEDDYMFRVMAHNAGSFQYNQFQTALEAVEADLKLARQNLQNKTTQKKGKTGGVESDALKEVKAAIRKRAEDPNNLSDFEIAEEINSMLHDIGMIQKGLTDVYSSGGQDIKAQYGPMAFTYNRIVGGIITPTIGQLKTLARNYWEYPIVQGELFNKLSGTSFRGYGMAFKAMFGLSIKAGFRVAGGGVVGFGKGAKLAYKHFESMLTNFMAGNFKLSALRGIEGAESWIAEMAQEAGSRALYRSKDMQELNRLGLAQAMDIPATMESLRTMPKSGGVIRDVSQRGEIRNFMSGIVNALISMVEYATTPTIKALLPRMADESMNAASINMGIAKVQEYQVQLLKAYLQLKELGTLGNFDFANPYSQKNIDLFLPEYLIQGRGMFAKQNLKTAYDQARLTFSNAQITNLPAEAVKYWAELQEAENSGKPLTGPQFLTDGERSSVGYEFATFANAPTALNRNISLKRYGSLGRSIALLGGYPMTLLSRISTSLKRPIKDPSYDKMMGALIASFIIGIGFAARGLNEILLQIFNRKVIDPFQGEEKKARMFWEEGTDIGKAYNLAQQISNQIPFIGTVAMNTLLTDQPTRNELEPFGLLKDKAGDAWNYVAGALKTGDLTYNLNNTLKSTFPILRPALNRVPGASGISEHMNVKRLASIYAPEDLRKSIRGYVGGGNTATPLSPYGLKILNAIMNEDQDEAKSLFNEAIEVAMRDDGDTYSRAKERIEQKIASMNPWRQRLKRTPTYSERQEMFDRMTPGEQNFVLQAEQKLSRGAASLGVNINFFKQGTEIGKITKKIQQRNRSRFTLSNPYSGKLSPLNPFN